MNWYLYRNNEQTGPYGDKEFFKMGHEGKINPTDHVWNSSMQDWTPAGKLPDLINVDGNIKETPPLSSSPNDSEKNLIMQTLLSYSDAGPFKIEKSVDTDLLISNEVTDSNWYSGKKKVTYTAQLLLKEEEKTAYYWEMLKETSAGLSFKVGFEKKKIKGIELFQQSNEKGYNPTGELVYDYQFDYGSLREALKRIITSQGWKFKVVLRRGITTY